MGEQTFSVDDIAKHTSTDNCWIILGKVGEEKVYDVTGFLNDHPGGPELLKELAGQNATEEFEDVGHSSSARKMVDRLCIGKVIMKKDQNYSQEKETACCLRQGKVKESRILIALSIISAMIGIYFGTRA